MENTQPLPKMPDRPWNPQQYVTHNVFQKDIAKCYQPAKSLEVRIAQCYETMALYNTQYKKCIQDEIAIREYLKTQDLGLNAPAITPTEQLGKGIEAKHLKNALDGAVVDVDKADRQITY